MPYLVVSIDVTRGRLTDAANHDLELRAVFDQARAACSMRALPQELYDSDRNVVGEVRFQERPPNNRGLPKPAPVPPPAYAGGDPKKQAAADRKAQKAERMASEERGRQKERQRYWGSGLKRR